MPVVRALKPDRCVSSDLVRARQTAEILGHPEPELDPDWREIDVGEWGGRLATDVDPELLADWRAGLEEAPGGEPRDRFLQRVGAALDRLGPADGRTVLVSTHGGCVRMACAHVSGGSPNAFGPIPNASLSMITVERRPRVTVLSWVPDPLSRGPATDLASG